MPRKSISIDEKIARAQEAVDKAKAKYDAALKELESLETKKEEAKKEELIEMISKSSKSYNEIVEFFSH